MDDQDTKREKSLLFMLSGDKISLPNYNEANKLQQELGKLQKNVQDDASAALKKINSTARLTVKSMIKSPGDMYTVPYCGVAILKIQSEDMTGVDCLQLPEKHNLQLINEQKEIVEMEIDPTLEDNIPNSQRWIDKLQRVLSFQNTTAEEKQKICGTWFDISVVRGTLIELNHRFSIDFQMRGTKCNTENIENTKKLFAEKTIGTIDKVSTPYSFRDTNVDIFWFFCFFNQTTGKASLNINIEAKADFNSHSLEICLLGNQKDVERFKKSMDEFLTKLSKFKYTILSNMPWPNIAFLTEAIEDLYSPEIVMKFCGGKHVYIWTSSTDSSSKVKGLVDMYTKFHFAQGNPAMQTRVIPYEQCEASIVSNTGIKSNSAGVQTEKNESFDSEATGYFQREKDGMANLYVEHFVQIEDVVQKCNSKLIWSNNNSLITIKGQESNVLGVLTWLEMFYDKKMKPIKQAKDHALQNKQKKDDDNSENYVEYVTQLRDGSKIELFGQPNLVANIRKHISNGVLVITRVGNDGQSKQDLAPKTHTVTMEPSNVTPKRTVSQSNTQKKSDIKRFKEIYSGAVIEVGKGDITKLTVDAIVNAANNELKHAGGVAKAIATAAGNKLIEESRQTMEKLGRFLNTGETITTTAGNLPCRVVIHAVGPKWREYPNKEECKRHLADAFTGCLSEAVGQQCSSVALPAISSGIYGVPLGIVADVGVTTIVKYLHNEAHCGLKLVRLVDINDDSLDYFVQKLSQLVASGELIHA